MRSKLISSVIVLALLLGLFGTALAQQAPAPYCGNLATADCTVLQKSQDAMQKVASYSSKSSFALALSGLPGLPSKETAVSFAIDGTYSADEATRSALQSVSGLSQAEMQSLLADKPELLVQIANGWNFDATLKVTLDAALAGLLSAQTGLTVPETISLPVRMVNGVLYYDASELAAFIAGIPSGWVGVPVGELATRAQKQGLFAQASAAMNPDTLKAAGMSGASGAAFAALQMMLKNPEPLRQFVTIKRGDDTTVDGKKAAVFVSTFDWVGFLTSPEFSNVVKGLASSGALGQNAPSAADIDQGLQMLTMLGPTLFAGIKSEATQTIGLEDNYQYGYKSTFDWDLASLMQMAAMSGSLPAELKPTSSNPKISLGVDVTDTNYSTSPSTAIAAPENAQMYTADQFIMQ